MKILVISQHYYPENFRITDICEELVKRDFQVDVICGLPNYPEGIVLEEYKKKINREQKINGVNIHRCYEIGRGNSKLKLFLNYYSVCLSMKRKAKRLKEKYDLVFINQLSPVMVSWAGLTYAKKNNVPCIMYCYDLWPDSLAAGGINKKSLIYKYFFKISNKCYHSVDKIFVTSKMFINYFKTIHNIFDDKIEYLPQYCEDIFANIKFEESNNHYVNYVFAGNVGKMQSVETIIKAAKFVKKENIKIHIIGDGSNLEMCKRLCENYELDNVYFYGKRPLEEMPKFYSFADAMIVSLVKNDIISKTLPGKIQSYMSAGKPIIGCIDGETQEIIKEANCGLCCEAEDSEKLAELFIQMAKLDRKQLGYNAKNYYIQNFTKELFYKKLINEMENIIEENI